MSDKQIIQALQGPHWRLNKILLRVLGINPTLWLADIMQKWLYFEERNMLDEDGYFFNTQKDVEKDTTLSPAKQRLIIKKLEKKGIVKTKRKGIPGKQHIKLFPNQLLNFFTTTCEEIKPINNNKQNNNKSNKSSKEDNTRPRRAVTSKILPVKSSDAENSNKSSNQYNNLSDKPKAKRNNYSVNNSLSASELKSNYKEEISLLSYWNDLNIIKHKSDTKNYLHCLGAATKALKKSDFDSLCVAMDNYRSLLDSSPFYNHKFSFKDFIYPDPDNEKVTNLFHVCLDGTVFEETKYMGNKRKNGYIKKKIEDPHPNLTKEVAQAFNNRFFGGAGKLIPQTKDYIYFMDGADIVKHVKFSDEQAMSSYGKEYPEIINFMFDSLVNFMEDNEKFRANGVHPYHLSSDWFVREVILHQFSSNDFHGELDVSSLIPGKYKKEYIETNN